MTNPVPMTEEELDMINEFYGKLKEDDDILYLPEFTGGYRFTPDYEGSTIPEDMQDLEGRVYVLCVDGEYLLDPCFTFLMEFLGEYVFDYESIEK